MSLLFGEYSTTELFHSSTNYFVLLHFTQLHCIALSQTGSCLGAEPTENTFSSSPSIVVMGGCLAIAHIVDVFTGCYQATHVPSCNRCIAAVLHATIYRKSLHLSLHKLS
jgi:hypothetical protein